MHSSESTQPQSYWLLACLLITVALLWGFSGWFLYSKPDRGTFGDMFGAINALFSGLAFASLIYTISLQRQDLQLQREELKLTRQELEGQKIQLVAQNEVLKLQNFENTFFQLLRLLNDTVNSIDLQRSGGTTTTGRDCFSFFFSNFRACYIRTRSENPSMDEQCLISTSYAKFYVKYQGDVAHYFRTLYNIIKFVHSSEVTDKRLYTNLIRAQLSSQELLLLFYNCQTELGLEKFRPLLEEYALLKTVPRELLLKTEHEGLYAEKAFGKS